MKKKNIIRVCSVCKQNFNRQELIKITCFKNKEEKLNIILDSNYNIPGRSIYIFKSKHCVIEAKKYKKKILNKLKRPLYPELEKELEGILNYLIENLPENSCPLVKSLEVS